MAQVLPSEAHLQPVCATRSPLNALAQRGQLPKEAALKPETTQLARRVPIDKIELLVL